MKDQLIEYEQGVSNCCSAKVIEHSQRCEACKENCVVIDEE